MALARSRPRNAAVALGVLLAHGALLTAAVGTLRILRNDDVHIVPMALTFYATPPPPLPYLPQGFALSGAAPSPPVLAPLPQRVLSFAPPATNAITLPPPASAGLKLLGRALNCNLASYEILSWDEKLRCAPSLGRAAGESAQFARAPAGQEALWEGWAAVVAARHRAIAFNMPRHEIYGEWWKGIFWPVPQNSHPLLRQW